MESPRGQTDKGKTLVACPKASFPLPKVGDLKRKSARKVLICQGSGAGETGVEKTASTEQRIAAV